MCNACFSGETLPSDSPERLALSHYSAIELMEMSQAELKSSVSEIKHNRLTNRSVKGLKILAGEAR
jgi:hypothetical protein